MERKQKQEQPQAWTFEEFFEVVRNAAHTVAFRMGWWDKVRGHGEIAAGLHQGVTTFYTLMENLPEDNLERLGAGWTHNEAGKPIGPAIPLAGVILGIADYFGSQGWDLGGAILAQLQYKEHQAGSRAVVESRIMSQIHAHKN